MKNILVETMICVALLFNFSSRSFAADIQTSPPNGGPFPAPELVKVPLDDVFAPPGFDDNDDVQIVIHGSLINTCYKAALPEVSVDRASRVIAVSAKAYVYSSSWCLQYIVPVTQTVDLGILPAGHYRVIEYNSTGRLIHDTALPIAVSITAAADDFLYAPVKHMRLDRTGSKPVLVLSGDFSSDCMDMQEVKVLHRVSNVIEVLPVAAYKSGSTCQSNPHSFEVRVNLPEVAPGDTLIHVRSLNGQSINDVEVL